jgi:hypothetical protein
MKELYDVISDKRLQFGEKEVDERNIHTPGD